MDFTILVLWYQNDAFYWFKIGELIIQTDALYILWWDLASEYELLKKPIPRFCHK